jgi:hypothetical protein
MALGYRTAGLGSGAADPALVRALQRDLRAMGYLRRGIDGTFGEGTRAAVRALQFDLMHNAGASTGGDGPAPVPMTGFNRGVEGITGIVDAPLADSIEAALADSRVTWLPQHNDPAAANRAALTAIAGVASAIAPAPFIAAMVLQESGGEHFAVPRRPDDTDSFVTVGLDRNGAADQVTSRGYGLGQYTIYHHPPRPDEVAGFILDPVANVRKAFAELRDKLDHFVAGTTPGTRADDRTAEHPGLALRLCRHPLGDPAYLKDCRSCALAAGTRDIDPATSVYRDASQTYGEASLYPDRSYRGIPDRSGFLCDWPYAVRRYNGSGPNSYHYQAIVLRNLLAGAL